MKMNASEVKWITHEDAEKVIQAFKADLWAHDFVTKEVFIGRTLDGFIGRKEVNGVVVQIYMGASADNVGDICWLGTPQAYVNDENVGESQSVAEAIQISETAAQAYLDSV